MFFYLVLKDMAKKIDTILQEALIRKGLVSQEIWDDILKEAALSEGSIVDTIVKKGLILEKEALKILAQALNLECVESNDITFDKSVADKIPLRIAFYYKFMPLKIKDKNLTIAVSFPLDVKTCDEIRIHLGYHINMVLAPQTDILEALKKLYGVGAETLERITSRSLDKTPIPDSWQQIQAIEDIEELAEDASVIKLVNEIILEAYRRRATDIHIEPYRNDVSIRYRIDGTLYDVKASSEIRNFIAPIISRIKIMCNLNIVERRLPQDGRAIVKTQEQDVDLRVSTLPTPYGESVVIRILPTKMLFNLEKLGLSGEDLSKLEALIRKPYGIIFVTGPTGSGKTTTLYACLNRINTRDQKIITIEDPIEYDIKGVTQIQVQPEIGLDFARGLRSILRHDPDVIMVGEVRDLETAEISIRVALTGHLIFSTLHTNDAASGVTRLIDIGIEPYLISSSVEAFIAQRLVRMICPHCKYEDRKSLPELRESIQKELRLETLSEARIYRGKGCQNCNFTGFFGRTAIYENLLVDDAINELIVNKTTSGDIKKKAVSQGMRTLSQDGWRKVIAGITIPEEVLRLVSAEDYIIESVERAKLIFDQAPLSARDSNDNLPGSSSGLEAGDSPDDKRLYPRLESNAKIHYKVLRPKELQSDKIDYLKNISAGGISFNTSENLSVDSILQIRIELPQGEPAIECLGKVVWIKEIAFQNYSVGLCFLDLTGGERTRLLKYISKELDS